MRSFWVQLAAIPWCPVLVQAPEPGMPWPWETAGAGADADAGAGLQAGAAVTAEASGKGTAGPAVQLAPPRMVRPLGDAWLCSASLRILDGECR